MNDMETLAQRVNALEELVKKIIALPHLSNLAGRDSRNFVIRLNMAIASDKKKLTDENLTDDERKAIEERITRNEYLVSPALDATLHDSGAKESPSAQAAREG